MNISVTAFMMAGDNGNHSHSLTDSSTLSCRKVIFFVWMPHTLLAKKTAALVAAVGPWVLLRIPTMELLRS